MKFSKYLGFVITIGLLMVGGLSCDNTQKYEPIVTSHEPLAVKYKANRISIRPIVETAMHHVLRAEAENYGYSNVNGPSAIRVPDWVENPLGQYYLYFAHHKGTFLRMAYADNLGGPWQVYNGPIMPLAESGFAQSESAEPSGISDLKKYLSTSEITALVQVGKDAQKAYEQRTQQQKATTSPTAPHIASPDVIVDNEKKQIRLYYHGVVEGTLQMSKVALSTDGLNFTAQDGLIGAPYLRVFKHKDYHYGLAMPGFLYRSKDGISDWELRDRWFFGTDVRHSSVHLLGDLLYIFYSEVGDEPERIKYTVVNMADADWNTWAVGESYELLRPKLGWEGANKRLIPSLRGESGQPVHELRDPYVFNDEGKLYLFYTGGGEQGIGLARMNRI